MGALEESEKPHGSLELRDRLGPCGHWAGALGLALRGVPAMLPQELQPTGPRLGLPAALQPSPPAQQPQTRWSVPEGPSGLRMRSLGFRSSGILQCGSTGHPA